MDDPRKGLPSGSSALQDSLCPGRWRAQKEFETLCSGQDLGEIEEHQEGPVDDIDKDRDAGRRIHKLYANEPCPDAKPAEIERADAAKQVDKKMKAEWMAIFDPAENVEITELREWRWWLKDDDGNPVYSGQTDVVWIRGNEGQDAEVLLGDLKGLWGYHDPAPINMQIRRYIALMSSAIKELGYSGLKSVWAYLNQPAKTMSPKFVLYNEESIQMAVLEMYQDLSAMQDPAAERRPGPVQCHHCKAKLICEEWMATQDTTLSGPVETVAPIIPSKEQMQAGVERLSGARLAAIIPWAKALGNFVELAEAEAKRRLRKDPASVPGWELKKNPMRSKVEDIKLLYSRLNAAYEMTGAEFINLCTVTKRALEEKVRELSKLKGKALDERMDNLLDGVTKPIPVSDSLVESSRANQ